MSSTPSRTSTNDSTSSSTFRVNYSDYVADITGSPKTTRKLVTTGIGHHINPLHNPYPNRPNPPAHQQQQQQQQQTGGMPHYGGGAEKCARCLKSVYLAEKKVGAGRSFHSSCFCCHTCKRKLDASMLSEHKGEIYCKPCYTKQFGAHGLISGVTMSTEHTATREIRSSRRSSFGNDLDAPANSYQQSRQRANSSENVFRDDYGTTHKDEFSQKYPRHTDDSRERTSPASQKNNGVNVLVDFQRQRSSSPTAFNRPIASTTINDRPRSNHTEEVDRKKYTFEGEKLPYGSGASALVEIPVVVHPKRADITIGRMDIPVSPARDSQRSRSRSPSITSTDSYQRQSSLADDLSRVTINEDKNNRKYPTDNSVNTIAVGGPHSTRNFYQSTSSSSYETKYKSATSNANNYDREQYHSRESSPSIIDNRKRSPSPTNSYTSSTSSTTRTDRVEPSRPSAFVPHHDYLNTQTSSNFNDRRSPPSPQTTHRASSGLNDFVSKTNLAGHSSSSTGNQFSTLGALIDKSRRQNDDFDQ